jgi:uncharacterized protein YndB with AHSA1/START domain
MAMDFSTYLRGTDRSVTEMERDGRPARGVTLERSYGTSVEDLWDAVTNPERLPRWFLPVSGDLRPGGRYALEGNASGTIERCEPPRELAVTWEFAGEMSWVEVRLAAEGDSRSRLTLCHICPVDDVYWPKYGPGAAGVGWDFGLIGLDAHVGGADAEGLDEDTFSTTPEGRAFVGDVSTDWGRAEVAGGEDRATAEARATRTTAFYLGEEQAES